MASVYDYIAKRRGLASDPMLEDGLDAEPMQEVDEEGERVPYNTIAKPGSAMPGEALEMGATPEMRQGQAEGNLISNMGRAFSNAARGTNAPSDNSGLFSAIDSQNASLVKQGTEDLNRRAKVMQAIAAQRGKADQLAKAELFNREKFDESKRHNRASEQAMMANAEASRGIRMGELGRKADEKELTLAVPGYERTGEVLPKAEEAQKLRKASANATQLSAKLKRLKELVDQNGSFEYGGQAGTEMDSLATEIQLLSKGDDMYQLGVLTGPDMQLLTKITASPSSLDSLFTFDSTRKKQLDTQLKSITDKLDSTAASMGYRKAGAPSGGKPKTVIQDGHTYTLNPATGEYE
jgi:hypothetical protein